ncbi:MAG: M48 family metalloprotease [Oligoflexia bacterium]|nr:M48 family metalloprotease [Oligoflexia bacterium]
MKTSRLFLKVALLIGLIGCAGSGTGLNLYSYEQEASMGAKFAQQIKKEYKLMNDPFLDSYIRRLCSKMVSRGIENPHFDYQCHVVDSSEINAFAIPGGHLYVNLALLKEAESEAELIGVMGHEIGHVVHRHGTKKMTDAALVQLAAAGTAKAAGRNNEQTGALAGMGVMLFGQAGLLHYGRKAELESDRTGVDILYRIGYDVQGMPSFFKKLAAIEKSRGVSGGGLSDLLRTHPRSDDRVREAESYIATLPRQQNPMLNGPEWDGLKTYVAKLTPTPTKR